jgi:hypothetical protein
MSRRSVLVTLGIVLCLIGSIAGVLGALVHHELEWYTHASVPPGHDRTVHSDEFSTSFLDLITGAEDDKLPWAVGFTDEQINSFFAEGFIQSGLERKVLPEGVSDPRIALEPGKLRLAFRYGKGAWSTVISIDFGVWLATGEQNALVLELEAFRAGAMPIAAQSVLQHITDAVKNNNSNVELNWYRNPATGRPCAVLRIQPDHPRPTIVLQTVQIEQGKMVIGCKYNDGGSPRATLTIPGLIAMRTAR